MTVVSQAARNLKKKKKKKKKKKILITQANLLSSLSVEHGPPLSGTWLYQVCCKSHCSSILKNYQTLYLLTWGQ